MPGWNEEEEREGEESSTPAQTIYETSKHFFLSCAGTLYVLYGISSAVWHEVMCAEFFEPY